jgi:hypothetical protein
MIHRVEESIVKTQQLEQELILAQREYSRTMRREISDKFKLKKKKKYGYSND